MCVGVNVSVLCSQCHIVHKDVFYMRAEQHPTFFSQEATWGSQHYSGGTLEPDHFLVLLVSSANDITCQVKAGLILLCLNSCVSCQNSSGTPSAVLIARFLQNLSDNFEMSVNHNSKSPWSDVMKWKKNPVFSAQNVDVLKFGRFTSTATTALAVIAGLLLELYRKGEPLIHESSHMWGIFEGVIVHDFT